LIDSLLDFSFLSYKGSNHVLASNYLLDIVKVGHIKNDLDVLYRVHKLLFYIWDEFGEYNYAKENLKLLKDIAGMDIDN
jgi:hypothetical protein